MKARNLVGLAGCAAAVAAYACMTRPWHPRWGRTDEEVRTPFPGEDPGVPASNVRATHAVTVYGLASEVWGWLLQQTGQEPGGFYSYSSLDSLMGCRLRKGDCVGPDWQDPGPALSVLLRPKAKPFPAANTTRVIARGSGDEVADIRKSLLHSLHGRVRFVPAHSLMKRTMLPGIKHRSEARGARAGELERAG